MLGSGDSILVLVHVYLVLTSTHGVYATESWGWGLPQRLSRKYVLRGPVQAWQGGVSSVAPRVSAFHYHIDFFACFHAISPERSRFKTCVLTVSGERNFIRLESAA